VATGVQLIQDRLFFRATKGRVNLVVENHAQVVFDRLNLRRCECDRFGKLEESLKPVAKVA
jgi:hypothetical protein